MGIRIAPLRVEGDDYYVVFPSPYPGRGPEYMVVDAAGAPVCFDETFDYLRDIADSPEPDAFVEALEAAADAAVARGGEPLEGRIAILGDSAIELAEGEGWLHR